MKNFLGINWSIRFTRDNAMFWIRFLGAILVPVLAYLGVNFEDVTSWLLLWTLVIAFFSNPYLVFLTIINIIIMIPDPTTKGFSDSMRAQHYVKPGGQ